MTGIKDESRARQKSNDSSFRADRSNVAREIGEFGGKRARMERGNILLGRLHDYTALDTKRSAVEAICAT